PLGALKIGPDFTQMSSMSTWVIEALNLNEHGLPEAQGTAFFLKGVGLVTAAHCRPNNCTYLVFDVENPAQKYTTTIEKFNKHVDLAILQHIIPKEKYLELQQSTRETNVGEEVRSWGFPAYGPGKKLEVKSGRISSKP